MTQHNMSYHLSANIKLETHQRLVSLVEKTNQESIVKCNFSDIVRLCLETGLDSLSGDVV